MIDFFFFLTHTEKVRVSSTFNLTNDYRALELMYNLLNLHSTLHSCFMYNIFINTHSLNTCAESLENIKPEKPLEPIADLFSLLLPGMKHGGRHGDFYHAVVLL